jgi:DNA primase
VGVGRIPEETIEAIRSRIDIVDLVGRYVGLRPAGRSFKGLCPFHREKTPSFQVNPQLGIFHCFGCSAGGNAFAFLMRHDNLTFPEAVRALGRECGIEVPESDEGGEAGLGRRLRGACAAAERFYRAALGGPEGEAARAYLARRGLDAAAADRFGLGFAPERWDALSRALASAGVPGDLALRAGLLAEGRSGGTYDRLRGRVVFPIRDVRGDAVAFGGRALPDAAGRAPEPKYLNTPESALFRKREAFYGMPDALEPMRRSGRAVVVEGYFDRIALARAGVGEALATCGTALTPDHARQLRRRTREVVLLFDGDEAGARAVERSLALLLPEGLRVRWAELPAEDDPDTFLDRHGEEALRSLVDAAAPALEGVIRRAVAGGVRTPWEKADAVAAVAPLLVLVEDAVERGEHARQLAFAAGVPAEEVEASVRKARIAAAATALGSDTVRVRTSSGSLASADESEVAPMRPRVEGPDARAARRLVWLLVDQPALAGAFEEGGIAGLFPAPWDRVLPGLLDVLGAGADPAAGSLPADALDRLASHLDPEAAAELRAAALEGGVGVGQADARREIGDTILRLRQRREAEQRRDTTRRFREGTFGSHEDFLAEKQRQIEERRRAQGLAPGPGRS